MKTKKLLQEWQEDLEKYCKTVYKVFFFSHGIEIFFNDNSKIMYREDGNKYFVKNDRGLSNQAKDLKVFLDSILDYTTRIDFVNVLLLKIEKKMRRI